MKREQRKIKSQAPPKKKKTPEEQVNEIFDASIDFGDKIKLLNTIVKEKGPAFEELRSRLRSDIDFAGTLWYQGLMYFSSRAGDTQGRRAWLFILEREFGFHGADFVGQISDTRLTYKLSSYLNTVAQVPFFKNEINAIFEAKPELFDLMIEKGVETGESLEKEAFELFSTVYRQANPILAADLVRKSNRVSPQKLYKKALSGEFETGLLEEAFTGRELGITKVIIEEETVKEEAKRAPLRVLATDVPNPSRDKVKRFVAALTSVIRGEEQSVKPGRDLQIELFGGPRRATLASVFGALCGVMETDDPALLEFKRYFDEQGSLTGEEITNFLNTNKIPRLEEVGAILKKKARIDVDDIYSLYSQLGVDIAERFISSEYLKRFAMSLQVLDKNVTTLIETRENWTLNDLKTFVVSLGESISLGERTKFNFRYTPHVVQYLNGAPFKPGYSGGLRKDKEFSLSVNILDIPGVPKELIDWVKGHNEHSRYNMNLGWIRVEPIRLERPDGGVVGVWRVIECQGDPLKHLIRGRGEQYNVFGGKEVEKFAQDEGVRVLDYFKSLSAGRDSRERYMFKKNTPPEVQKKFDQFKDKARAGAFGKGFDSSYYEEVTEYQRLGKMVNWLKDWAKLGYRYLIKRAIISGVDQVWIPTAEEALQEWGKEYKPSKSLQKFNYDGVAKVYGGKLTDTSNVKVSGSSIGAGALGKLVKEHFIIDMKNVPRELTAQFDTLKEVEKMPREAQKEAEMEREVPVTIEEAEKPAKVTPGKIELPEEPEVKSKEKGEEEGVQDRVNTVIKDAKRLRDVLEAFLMSSYKLKLSEEELNEICRKIMSALASFVSDITTERIEELTGLGEEKK